MSGETANIGRDTCYICSQHCPHLLERAHKVPNRMGGKETRENLVELCPTCHRSVDMIFDYAFFGRLEKKFLEQQGE